MLIKSNLFDSFKQMNERFFFKYHPKTIGKHLKTII